MCTGIAASWCPVHGDCTCPRYADGEIEFHYEGGFVAIAPGIVGWDRSARHVSHFDPGCPIHGETTDHASVSRPSGDEGAET